MSRRLPERTPSLPSERALHGGAQQTVSRGSAAALGMLGSLGAVSSSSRAASSGTRISVQTKRLFAVDLSSTVGELIPLLAKQFNHNKDPSVFNLVDIEHKKVLNPARSLAAQGISEVTPLELIEADNVDASVHRTRDFVTRKNSFADLRKDMSPSSPEDAKRAIEQVRATSPAKQSLRRKDSARSASSECLVLGGSGASSPSGLSATEDGPPSPLTPTQAPSGKTMRRRESRATLVALKQRDDLPPTDLEVYIQARDIVIKVRISPSASFLALTVAVMKDRKVKGDPGEFGIWLQVCDDDSGFALNGVWADSDRAINSADTAYVKFYFLRRQRKLSVIGFNGVETTITYRCETTVADAFRTATGRELGPSHDMALFNSDGSIMDRDRTLWSYRIPAAVRAKMRERPIVVFLREGEQRQFQVDYSRPVQELIQLFCTQFGVGDSPSNYYLICLHGKAVPLTLEMSLADQNVVAPASVILKSKKKASSRGHADAVSPLLEKDGDDVNVYNEGADSAHNIRYGTRELKPGEQPPVLAASFNKLVERLTSADVSMIDLGFTGTFLLTYQSFTTTTKLLRKLLQRYDVPQSFDPEKRKFIQMRVCSVLLMWLEKAFAEDLDHELTQALVDWIDERVVADHHDLLANKLRHAILQRTCGLKREKHAGMTIGRKIPDPMIPKDAVTLWDFVPEEVARQIALIDFDFYFEIKPQELLNQNWNKHKELAPNVETQISRMNQLGMWATNSILESESPSGRAKRWTKLIRISQCLRDLNNFNTIAALLGGMQNASINRLKKTHSQMPKKVLEDMKELNQLMSPNGSYKNLRAALQGCSLPCIPFLGMYLRDLTFIEDGNKDYLDGLINWEKRTFLHRIIAEVQRYQQISYSYIRVQKLADTFLWLPNLDDKMLYEISLQREPRT